MTAAGPWAAHAACHGKTDLFTLPIGTGSSHVHRPFIAARITKAKAICASCPVRADCHTWVTTTVPDPAVDMIAAGLAPWERNRTVRACAGRRHHDRCHITPCDECAAITRTVQAVRLTPARGAAAQHGSRNLALKGCDCPPCTARRETIREQVKLNERRRRGRRRLQVVA